MFKKTHEILSVLYSLHTPTRLDTAYISAVQKKNTLHAFLNYWHLKKKGLGSEPPTLTSSQDMLYSARTVRHRAAILRAVCQGKQLTLAHGKY